MTNNISSKPARRFARMKEANAVLGAENVAALEATTASRTPRAATKIAEVTRLLKRLEGASLDEMVAATGWLTHTTRAALTGLKKKGEVITKGKRGDVTCYFIATPAP